MPTDPATPEAHGTGALLRAAIAQRATAATGITVEPAEVVLSAPRQAGHGDLATNVAMVLAKRAGKPPREIAVAIAQGLGQDLGSRLAGVEVAGPGFINLTFGDRLLREGLAAVAGAGAAWGGGTVAVPERINVEFVSANPTGPMHIGHARNAAYGDALARLLAFHGHDVDREYYVNDFGSQVKNLGASIAARAKGEEVPEGGYLGEYVKDLAGEIPGAATATDAELSAAGVATMLAHTKVTLDRFGVEFDRFFSERTLHEGDPSALDTALELLRESGDLQQEDGAWWLRTEKRGDDKDRVVVRASGEPTYFAADLAYLRDKIARGYDRLILVLGADHHGYIARMRAAMASFGGDPDHIELLTMQLVNLVAGGEQVKMSKRAGQFVTVDDLVDEIGLDASRWYLLQRSHDTAVELDVELARKESTENPVYYVQYAHARACSVLEKVGEEARTLATSLAADADEAAATLGGLRAPVEDAERTLIMKLGELPAEVAQAADRRAPHRIATYALELAQVFTAFYRDCKIAGAEGDGVEAWRASLTVAARDTLATSLGLLGVAAPERMERREEETEATA